ncbi:hypothetical protein Gpo141_00006153 [Globisporangium polare]
MIHPEESSGPTRPAPPPVLYEIVASGLLPSFDPLVTVKQRLLSKRQIRVFNRVIRAISFALFPMYMAGFVLRYVTVFASAELGRIMGPVTLALQIPIAVQVVFAFRLEYLKVLTGTFEFCFLMLNATLWACCFAVYLQDTRALIIPLCWLDFVNLLLIETYFQDMQNVAVAATVSAGFLFSLSVGISLNAIESASQFAIARVSQHLLTSKDVLVNTMATMIMILMRLAYRKYDTLSNNRRALETGLWTQSMGYRCRIELRSHGTATQVEVLTAETIAADVKLLHMQFVQVSSLFDAADTVYPDINSAIARMRRWQLALLYGCGLVGFALTPVVVIPDAHTAYPKATPSFAVACISGTCCFWLPMLCCAQRQLLLKLLASFDFIFVCVQLVSAHVSLCDMLAWDWTYCCGIASSFLWMQGVLVLDAITPCTRVRLRWTSWLVVPALVSNMLMQLLLIWELFHDEFYNRLIVDSRIGGSYRVQFYVVPFFFSRQFTLFVWCIRLLNRWRTRRSEYELLLLLGNVEYNYAHWKQSRK